MIGANLICVGVAGIAAVLLAESWVTRCSGALDFHVGPDVRAGSSETPQEIN